MISNKMARLGECEIYITNADGTERKISTGSNAELILEKPSDSEIMTYELEGKLDLSISGSYDTSGSLEDIFSVNTFYQNGVLVEAEVFSHFKFVQARNHKKKRINKKWAKKYGYKEVPVMKKMKANMIQIKAEDVPYSELKELSFRIENLKEV